MTREEILEIDSYCQEHRISYRQRLEELNIPFWTFYKAKRKYRQQDEASSTGPGGGFVQLQPGLSESGAMPVRNSRGRKSSDSGASVQESILTIELRTAAGTAMRIQGVMSPAHLRELISGGNVQS